MGNIVTETANKMMPQNRDMKNSAMSSESGIEALSHNLGDKLGNMASDISDSAAAYTKTSRDFVKENPVTGVAIAAAAGIVAGSLLTMALRQRRH